MIDSILADYRIVNLGGNSAIKMILSKPIISRKNSFFLNRHLLGGSDVYTSLAAGQEYKSVARAIFYGEKKPISLSTEILYLHFFIEYKDIIGGNHHSYFIQNFTIRPNGNQFIIDRGDENQDIE